MGLLSDPQKRKTIVDAIAKYNNILCVLCYICGLTWFLALAYQPLNASNYFSENALLPGLVNGEFYPEGDIASVVEEFKSELKKDKRKVPRDWIYDRFRSIGLDTYKQNYSILYPLQITKGKTMPGQNVYGILRAPRASSNEVILMTAPLRSLDSDLPSTTGSIALMMELATFFRKKTYWSKDIIFLVSDHEQIGMQAWLDGYHDIKSEYIQPGELMGRSGQIQAAINIEFPEGNLRYIDLKIEGMNGQLPNLDLFNLVVRICQKERVDVTLHRRKDTYDPESVQGYIHSLKTMMKMMWTQASGNPSGNHGLFFRYHIEAITLEGVKRKRNSLLGPEKTGRVVEGVFRSLNNLLERFHQSFFFYVLPATRRYVSIGLYMPPFGLICLAGLIKAIALWIAISNKDDDKEKEKKQSGLRNKSKDEEEDEKLQEILKDLQMDGTDQLTDEQKQQLRDFLASEDEPPTGLLSILPLILISLLMGILCYNGPEFITNFAPPFRIRIEDTIMFGLLALFTASLFFPRMLSRKQKGKKTMIFDWEFLKSLSLIFQSLVLFSISLINISLAFFLAAILIPVTIIVQPFKRSIVRWLYKMVLFAVSPAIMVLIAAIVSNLEEKYKGFPDLLDKSWVTLKQGLLLTVVDNYFFSSWMYPLFSLILLPNWLLFWGISHCEVE